MIEESPIIETLTPSKISTKSTQSKSDIYTALEVPLPNNLHTVVYFRSVPKPRDRR